MQSKFYTVEEDMYGKYVKILWGFRFEIPVTGELDLMLGYV